MRRSAALALTLGALLPSAAQAAPRTVWSDGQGTVSFDQHRRVEERLGAAVALPGGGIAAVGDTGRGQHVTFVVLGADGGLDRTFGTGGATLVPHGAVRVDGLARGTGGALVAVAERGLRSPAPVLVRADAAGHLTGGVVPVPGLDAIGCRGCANVAVDGDGSVLVAGHAGAPPGNRLAIARVRADGTPDPGFGTGGVAMPLPGPGIAQHVLVRPGGGAFVLGIPRVLGDSAHHGSVLLALRADGTPDPAFGGGDGRVDIDADGGALARDAAERLLVLTVPPGGDTAARSAVRRLLADGRPDPTWTGGDLGLALYGTLFADPDGGVTVASRVDSSPGTTNPIALLLRLGPTGAPGASRHAAFAFGGGTFGPSGLARLAGPAAFRGSPLVRRADGAIVYGGDAGVDFDDGGAGFIDSSQWAVAAVRPDGTLAPGGASTALRISLRPAPQRLALVRRHNGLKVRVSPSRRGLANVTATANGRRIAAEAVPFWGVHRSTMFVRLTRAGRRLVRSADRVRVRYRITMEDLVGHRATDTARATLHR
jgi:hypothetical protein